MDPSMDIPDATDWLNTPLRQFSDLESALHCEICKEFYDTPMITSCSHTFCSKCIRTSLSADGKCPACRTADQASKLRNNWALQTVVATFLAARPEAISVARKEQELAAQPQRPGKRKRVDPGEMERMEGEGRTTRSKSRRVAASQTSQPDAIEIDDSDGDGDFEPDRPADGLVECPLGCGKRMKIEQVEPHLDRCEDEKKQASRAKSRTPVNGFGATRPPSRQSAKPQERLAELNYSLLKDQAMRKKLEELGLPTTGSKQLMVRRHTEWVNIWNANCDSDNPRSKRELLRELDAWERTQGGKAPLAQNTSASAIMRKDFDGNGWANKNKDEFSRLIADARRKKGNPATAPDHPKGDDPSEDPARPALNGDESSSPHFQHTPQATPPRPKSETSQPYAEHPEALLSVREKVQATKEGRHIEPVINEGFRMGVTDSTPNGTGMHGESKALETAPGGEHEALLAQSHFGRSTSSQDEHKSNHHTGQACDLPAHLQSSPKRLPMFAVPEQPVTDLDGAGDQVQ